MPKLLLTGVSGFLGWNICQTIPSGWSVVGVYHQTPVTGSTAEVFQLDLTRHTSVTDFIGYHSPDVVCHTAAATDPNWCQQNPEASGAINLDATVFLARLCAQRGIPFVFTSTDLVFDGQKAPYDEDAGINPVSLYGRQKANAEAAILADHTGALVCRMPLMFGNSGPVATSILQGMLKALEQDKPLKLFVDEYRTPVSGQSGARGIWAMIGQEQRGLWHLGGRERISRYDFGLLVSEVFGLPASNIMPAKQAEVTLAAPRPPDVSLRSERAFRAGYQPMNLKEELMAIRAAPSPSNEV